MTPKIANEIQAAQDHGVTKYHRGNKFADLLCPMERWAELVQEMAGRAKHESPIEQRERFVKAAGLCVTAIESFDINEANAEETRAADANIPTDEGKKRYPPDGMYIEYGNSIACRCKASCPMISDMNDCDGSCGCRACKKSDSDAKADALSEDY